ncbi:uncharacterized protein LOC126298981 [Schistocerca gregaria]|uniref:uncharacterized protein LOC126298981 n=1 Tax=Schistocerca gregaria TaxID=7010 RepID=UPI00211E633E|nr:uncharacterized protein LOC126298981 [Schistocerca gregaria]
MSPHYTTTPTVRITHLAFSFSETSVNSATSLSYSKGVLVLCSSSSRFHSVSWITFQGIMSSEPGNELRWNAVMCYFPGRPYYLRYQIGFDILVNPPDAQADPSVAGQPPRLIRVQLYFPDGIICNPAYFDEMPNPLSFEGDVPHSYPPLPDVYPPMHPDNPHPTQSFYRRLRQQAMMLQEQLYTRVLVDIANGQPGEFMVIDDTPYDVIPHCNECNEFHRDPELVHMKRPRGAPKRKHSKQSHKQPGRSYQRPSKSTSTDEQDTSHAAPHTAGESVTTGPKKHLQKRKKRTVTQQLPEENELHEIATGIQKKNVSTLAAVATIEKAMDRLNIQENNLQKQEKPTLTQQLPEKDGLHEIATGIQDKNASTEPAAATIKDEMDRLNSHEENDDGNVVQDNEKLSEDAYVNDDK